MYMLVFDAGKYFGAFVMVILIETWDKLNAVTEMEKNKSQIQYAG